MDIRARASSKSHVAETPIESHRRIYWRARFPRQQSDSPLRQSESPQANTGSPLALVEKWLRATACEGESAGIVWPIPDVANVAQCAPKKPAGRSRRTKFLKCGQSSLLKQCNAGDQRGQTERGITRKRAYLKATWLAGTISVPG